MGCASSADAKAAVAAPVPPPSLLQDSGHKHAAARKESGKGKGTGKAAGKGKGSGKGKGRGRGKGRGVRELTAGKFQVKLEGTFQDYGAEEDAILKRAYLVGQPNARFHLRGQDYEYSFKTMAQQNLGTRRTRQIRPPVGMLPPKRPILPPGSMTVLRVPANAGASLELADPNNPGQRITVLLPAGAKPGMQMAVPVPGKGEGVQAVAERQRKWGTGAKVAAGALGVGVAAVGGVILGEHLTDGAISEATGIAEIAAATAWTEDAVADAGEWVTGAAEDAHEWIVEAGEDVGEWTAGAVEDAGEWVEGAAEDIAAWLGDATEDIGEFVMELF
uniref:WWE domain-containing protein n=1 Tax=Zooxanthella nutricula TaxID=1333877 RepID=A0A7S2JQN5_9DINO